MPPRFRAERRHASGNAWRVRDTKYGQIVDKRGSLTYNEALSKAARLNELDRKGARLP